MEHSFISFRQSWEIESATWYRLGQCQAIIQAISATPLSPNYRERLYSVNLEKGVQATTAIEGNTLSTDDIRAIQGGNKIAPGKEYMEIEVRNVLSALNEIHSSIIVEKSIRLLSPELICDFNYKVGRDLGDHFGGQPGRVRSRNVTVGSKYRAPDYGKVKGYLEEFCDWSKRFFHYSQGQSFATAVIQAIVTHIYIAWIHPFADGNGRTARLLEFYLLLRGGVPDIASHILSNYYNETRAEYYQQLESCSRNGGDLTAFIAYAVRGFQNGLSENLKLIQQNQLEIAWHNFVRELFQSREELGVGVVARRRMQLVLTLEHDESYRPDQMLSRHPALEVQFSALSGRTLQRDLAVLQEVGLLTVDGRSYRLNTNILKGEMPRTVDEI